MRALIAVVAIAGCYNPELAPGAPCSADRSCPRGLECIAGTCETPGGPNRIDSGVDATPDGCAADRCDGDQLITCGLALECTQGCSDDGAPHCLQLAPSNGLDPTMLDGATADVTGDWTFYTDSGEIRKGNMTLRAAGNGLIADIGFVVVDGVAVWTANSFTVPASEDWVADGARPMALFAATTIDVQGIIDVGAGNSSGVAGGSDATSSTSATAGSCRGRAGRSLGPGLGEGGGGGGARHAGGNGAASSQNPTGIGGVLCSTAPTAIPLRGGSGGGHGAQDANNHGGGGGGAIALVAMQEVIVTGTVGAPGAGGDSGGGPSPSGDGGGGGGTGGAVFIEAPLVTLTGAVTANGGSGAAPRMIDGVRGSMTSSTPAAGGLYSGPFGMKRGGNGGAGTTAPTSGELYTDLVTTALGGGGGGAAGRIVIHSTSRATMGAVISPPATFDGISVQ